MKFTNITLRTVLSFCFHIECICASGISSYNFNTDTIGIDSLSLLTPAKRMVQSNNDFFAMLPDFPYKSPEAYAFQKYGQYQMNDYTGTPNIQIPLYTLVDRDVKIPLSLTYDASGIRVAQEASWVGLGWNLMIGGCINFIESGQIDKYDRMGSWEDYRATYDVKNSPMPSSNFKSYNDSDYFDFENGYIPKDEKNYATTVLHDLCIGLGERDFYSVNVLGKSFMFFFNPHTCKLEIIGKSSECFEIVPINDTPVTLPSPRHERNIYSYRSGFRVLDSEGNTYEFTNMELSCQGGITYPSAWNLTKMTTKNGNIVQFKYSVPCDISLIAQLSEQYMFSAVQGDFESIGYGSSNYGLGYHRSLGGQTFLVTKSFLKSIETDNRIVSFTLSSDRKDYRGALKLESLIVTEKNTGKKLKKYNFNYDYFIGNNIGGDFYQHTMKAEDFNSVSSYFRNRLKLLSIDEIGELEEKTTTSFNYNSQDLPLKTSYATDFWGYFNGQENINEESHIQSYRTSIPKVSTICYGGYTMISSDIVKDFGGGNRLANKDFMMAGLLERINYPTKGYSVLSYEPNTFERGGFLYPEFHEIEAYSTGHVVSSYTDNGQFICVGARADDSNVDNPYVPQYNHVNVHLSFSGQYVIQVFFRGNKNVNLRTLQADGAFVLLVSRKDGKIHSFSPKDMVTEGHELDTDTEASKKFKIHLESGDYVLVAQLPDKYGINTNCISSARLIADFTPQEIRPNIKYSTGGGVRIKSIENYSDKDGSFATRSEYEYMGGQLLLPVSFGEVWVKALYSAHNPYVSSTWSVSGYTVSNLSLTNVNSFVRSLSPGMVGYSKVVIRDYDGKEGMVRTTERIYANEPARNLLRNFYQFVDFNCGELLCEKIYDGKGILQKTENEYNHDKTAITCNIKLDDRSINDCCELQHCGVYGSFLRFYSVVYSYYRIWNKLAKTISTSYDEDSITTIHQYTYNDHNYKIATDTYSITGEGATYTTRYLYPADKPDDQCCSLMTKRHILSPIVVQSENKGGVELKRKQITYDYKTVNRYYTLFFPVSMSLSSNGKTLEKRIEYSNYDEFGNMGCAIKDNADIVVYLWSYNHTYPIAEITGATYQEVVNWLGGSKVVDELANKALPTEADLKRLRSTLSAYPVLLTTYLYEPGIGIRELTAPNGKKTTYEYDSFNRLFCIKNHEGKIVSKYNYNYTK